MCVTESALYLCTSVLFTLRAKVLFFRSIHLTAICITINPSATKMYCYNLAWHVYFHCCVPPADCWMQMTSSNHVIWQEITCLLQNSPVRFMLVAKYTGKAMRCSPTVVHGICYQMSPPTVGNICSLLFLILNFKK